MTPTAEPKGGAPADTSAPWQHAIEPRRAHGRVVHVSADFPDSIVHAKTRAVESFVKLADAAFDQDVISLNRAGPGRSFVASMLRHPLRPKLQVSNRTPSERVTPVVYHAPGKGIYHATMLHQLGEWLAEHLAAGDPPALLVGHKLTFEGLAVAEAARLLNVPYALTIQGDSDFKVLDGRPDLRRVLAACWHGAAMVVALAPWALARANAQLGERRGPVRVVPCAVASDAIIAPQPGGDGLLSVFHLRNARRKNLARMARAIARPAARATGARLAIVGSGTTAQIDAAQSLAAGPGRGHVVIEGHLPLAQVPQRMNRATGFIMPSLRESFGLVFIEALMAGLPIAYPQGWAVDGFFDDLPFALPVDARSVEAIADAMARLTRDEARLKAALGSWQATGGAERFRANAIASCYIEALTVALASGTPPAA